MSSDRGFSGENPSARSLMLTSGACPPHEPWRDPATSRVYCRRCGVEIPDEPVPIGGRLVPVLEYLDRLERERRRLEDEERRIHLMMDSLDLQIAGIRDMKCIWPGCDNPPLPRSKWCRLHKYERMKVTARERQRRRRLERHGCHA
jgi:hypothetical protein